MTTTSSNKQQQLKRALSGTFSSSDTVDFWRSQDLSVLFNMSRQSSGASNIRDRDEVSENSPFQYFQSTDSMRMFSQDFVANLMSTRDSGTFKSIDLLPLQSLDSIAPSNPKATDAFTSRDWLGGYEKDHTDVDYCQAQEVFQTSNSAGSANDIPPLPSITTHGQRKISNNSKWMSLYRETLANPIDISESEAVPKQVEQTKPKLTGEKSGTKKTTKKSTKYPSRLVEPKVKAYVTPTELDVLCGRGGRSNNWKGNEKYRDAIEQLKPIYRASEKHEKTIFAQQLIDALKEDGCRFVKHDEDVDKWYVVPDIVARRKAGQALREDNTAEARAAKRERYRKK